MNFLGAIVIFVGLILGIVREEGFEWIRKEEDGMNVCTRVVLAYLCDAFGNGKE